MILELLLYSKTVPWNIWLFVKLTSLTFSATHIYASTSHNCTYISAPSGFWCAKCSEAQYISVLMNSAYLANSHCPHECMWSFIHKKHEARRTRKQWSYYDITCTHRWNFITVNICWQKKHMVTTLFGLISSPQRVPRDPKRAIWAQSLNFHGPIFRGILFVSNIGLWGVQSVAAECLAHSALF